MFQPASLKGGSPTSIDERLRKKYMFIYLSIIVLSWIPVSFFEYWYISILWKDSYYWLFFILFPFNLLIAIYLLQFSALVIARIFLTVVNLIHKPREGIFRRDLNDKEYCYWNLRNVIKKWPLYIAASHPFPWFKNRFILRFFGVKIGRKCICDNSWISSEFVKIGKNVIIGMGSTLLSFGIEQDKFLLKRIIVEDNALIGAKCSLMPGTVVKRGSKLSAHSYTNYNQILEKNCIYRGHPAQLEE
ncbi:MAG: acyltransferase [Promethearchaeota archaeon]